jgi:hypothetical protein
MKPISKLNTDQGKLKEMGISASSKNGIGISISTKRSLYEKGFLTWLVKMYLSIISTPANTIGATKANTNQSMSLFLDRLA